MIVTKVGRKGFQLEEDPPDMRRHRERGEREKERKMKKRNKLSSYMESNERLYHHLKNIYREF